MTVFSGVPFFSFTDTELPLGALFCVSEPSTGFAAGLRFTTTTFFFPASFVPENIRITCSYGSKNLKATVTVLTSDDVARLEIDGNVVEPKTMKGKNKYTYSQKNVTAGTIYSIVAYDEAGTASETYTVVAE